MLTTYIIFILFIFNIYIINCSQFDCMNDDECSRTELKCNNDQECVLNCSGNESCKRTLIQCPINNKCIINCGIINNQSSKESICKYLIINATQSTHLKVQASSNWDTLKSSKIYCPYSGQCELYGQGTHVMTFMDIYAIRGFRDIIIECDECYLGKLYCTPWFDQSCHIIASDNQCQKPCNSRQQQLHTCDDYDYIYPSSSLSTGIIYLSIYKMFN